MINLHQGFTLVVLPWRTRLVRLGYGRVALTGLGITLALALFSSGVLLYYSGRILPMMRVAGVGVGGLSPEAAMNRLEEAAKNYRVSFVAEGKTFEPTLEEVGLTLDPAQTVSELYRVGHSGAFWHWVTDWWQLRQPERELSYRFDERKLDVYISSVVATTSSPAVNARLKVVGASIVVEPEVVGQATGVEQAESQIRGSLRALIPAKLVVGQKRLEPEITAGNLTRAKLEAERLIAPSVTLIYGGKEYAPTLEQRAAWLAFAEDTTAKTNVVTLDPAAIGRYLASAVAPKVAYAAVPKIVQVTAESGVQEVLQDGRDGLAIDQEKLAREVITSLGAQHAYRGPVPTQVVAFPTETRKVYERWIDVDLSEQRMWLYEKGTVIDTFLISSGKYPYVTPTGTFSVMSKTPIQDMDGDIGGYYFVPDVPWILWFKSGGYAIHGTYWHNDFGTPKSHGCLNLPVPKAKFVYDWAPVGAPVKVRA